jgi:hypothetical protein
MRAASSLEYSLNPQGLWTVRSLPAARMYAKQIFVVLTAVPVYPPSSTALFARHLNWLQRVWVTVSAQLPTLDLKDLLPIGIEIAKAVVICGNGATRSVLIFEFQRADGVVGIVPVSLAIITPRQSLHVVAQSRSKLDQYKQIVDLKLHNVASHFAENKEYEGSMVSTGERVKTALEKSKSVYVLCA